MKKQTINGFVSNIDVKDYNHLSLVTLDAVDKSQSVVPVYMNVRKEYVGRFVDITTEKKGLFGKEFRQSIKASNMGHAVEMPYDFVKKINGYFFRKEMKK